ncbi:unnamed protein product [Allacma fusca]|uniref:Poly [ADP-ribose] polymerase n=1 Tax=Allacma fusca TaxID=39272 RepID=A0A8J2NSB2_9HEXA|nr:unnamed protein product [Allacma fusca]
MNEVEIPRDIPYRAEYAKSGRAKCKHCTKEIGKGELRMAIMTKSRFFDGMQANWYHFECFFLRAKPKSAGDIAHFESLRWDDQKTIEAKIAQGGGDAVVAGSGKAAAKKAEGEYMVEYAKSSRSSCPACEKPIPKQEIRIGKKEYESERAQQFGPMFRWHHLDCFVKIREQLDFLASGKILPGFRDLERDDQKLLETKLPEIKAGKRKLPENGAVATKKLKTEKDENEKIIQKQNKEMYKTRDAIQRAHESKEITKVELQQLFKYNKQDVPSGSDQIYDRLADIMTFGALLPCKVCKGGQYVYRSGVGYYCIGHITEFTKCSTVTDNPDRKPFKVPKDLQEKPLLNNYKGKVVKRVIPVHAQTTVKPSSSGSSSSYKGPKINAKPLEKLKFLIDPTLDKNSIKKKIVAFGGEVGHSVSSKVVAVISSAEQVEAGKEKLLKSAKEKNIPVVSASFVENIRDVDYNLDEQLQVHLIVDWIKPLQIKTLLEKIRPKKESEEKKSMFELEMKKIKLKMKDGAVVDPDSGLEDDGHVYKEGKQFFSFILSKVDVDAGDNKYYKLQIIESDRSKKYWVFRAWGRLGTTIGGNQCDPMDSKESALSLFHKMYKDKTGNDFLKPFVKKPGCYLPMDIDYGQDKQLAKLEPSTKTSKLEMPVQKLICKIFDVNDMQRTLMEFEIDLEKMPLDSKEAGHHRLVADATNRFFSMIPHNFGTADVPMLNDMEFIKTKLDMLENLMEIELAYEMLQHDKEDGRSPVETHYRSLKCGISTLEHGSTMWDIIQKYLNNTHADTHDSYALEVDEVFTIDRKGEEERYEKFKSLHNRKLLWHGSRTSNFPGILSHGLRIAPKEAPVTGYMFGKGIYFADMVSKSANYCCTSRDNNVGLLLLCEVALGDMHELKDSKDTLLKAPRGKNSVKGVGKTEPDPSEVFELPTGTVVPYGKPVKSSVKNSSLLYNEYIVYDVAQVNILYLVQVNFKYKGSRR